MRKTLLFLLAAVLSMAVAPGHAAPATVLHVSPKGSDRNPGTSSKPFRTIAAAADRARPGTVIEVAPGVYGDRVRLDTPHVTVRGVGADLPLLRAKDGAAFEVVKGVSNIRLERFRIEGYTWGISLMGGNRAIQIAECSVTGAEAGIHLTAGENPAPVQDILIDRCTIRASIYSGIDGTPGPVHNLVVRRCRVEKNGATAGYGGDGIAVETGDAIVVEGCVIRDNGGDGVDIGSRATGPSPGNVVRDCAVVGNQKNGIKLWRGGSIENCLVARSGGTGVFLAYGGDYAIRATTIVNNARVARDYALTAGYDADPKSGRPPEMRLDMDRCIIALNGPEAEPTGIYVGAAVTLRERDNVFFSREDEEAMLAGRKPDIVSREDVARGGWPARKGDEHAGSTCSDPRFVNPEIGDYRVAEDAGWRDRGARDEISRYGAAAY